MKLYPGLNSGLENVKIGTKLMLAFATGRQHVHDGSIAAHRKNLLRRAGKRKERAEENGRR